jgi:Ca-activated chloride channel family protein
MIRFEWWWLFVLLPLPWLLARLEAYQRLRRKTTVQAYIPAAVRVPFYALAVSTVSHASSRPSGTQSRRLKLLMLLTWLGLIAAIMRPQWVGEPIAQTSRARDLMLAIDISPSMQETDLILENRQVPRLTVVKQVISQFLEAREGDRIGLILFGAQPYIQAPLTYDRTTVNLLLQEAGLGMAGNATAIGDAIGLAIKRLRSRPADSRILILLTDGANTAGEVSPEQAATLAAEAGIKIYTIGVGADEILRRSLFGMRKENPSADLDEQLLQAIAQTTGGDYFRAKSTGELEFIYEAINQLEPVEQAARFFRPTTEYFWIPALFSMTVFLIWQAMLCLRRVW